MAMAEPCQVDFYVLDEASRPADELVCRLTLMAWEQGLSVLLLTEGGHHAGHLDNLLWEQPPGRFIPHQLLSSGQEAPVTIATRDQAPGRQADVLINLTRTPAAHPDSFRRVLEVVPASGDGRQAAREKFKTYRDLGLKPAHHPVGRQ